MPTHVVQRNKKEKNIVKMLICIACIIVLTKNKIYMD